MAPFASVAALVILSGASAGRVRVHTNLHAAYELELTNYFNIQYYGNLTLGGQTLPVLYDTGSFEVIMLSNLCSECPNLLKYDNQKSSSFVGSGVEYVHNFASGIVHSRKGFDAIRLGPYSVSHFPFWQVMHHEIKALNKKEARFVGIVGLGHSDVVPEGFGEHGVNTTTLMTAMSIDSFSVCLERGEAVAPGHLLFGARSVMQQAPFLTLRVQGKSHWAVVMTELYAEGVQEDGEHCHPSCGAIVDSGTSLIAAPPAAADFVAELKQMIAQDCSNMHDLPVLHFQLDGQPVELPPAAWVWRVKKDGGEKCEAAFMTMDKSSSVGPVWILGMPFFRYYYTIFDRVANQLHITKSQPNCKPQGVSSRDSLAGDAAKELPGVSAFAAMDYQPLEADPSQAIAPAWAIGSGHIDL